MDMIQAMGADGHKCYPAVMAVGADYGWARATGLRPGMGCIQVYFCATDIIPVGIATNGFWRINSYIKPAEQFLVGLEIQIRGVGIVTTLEKQGLKMPTFIS